MDKDLEMYTKIVNGDLVKPIEDIVKNLGEYAEAYPTGYQVFDDAMRVGKEARGGIRNGELVVVTGRSGDGKTTFCQNIALNLKDVALPSLFFSYEVPINNIYAKFVEMGYENNGVIIAPEKLVSGDTNWIKAKIIEAKEKHMIKAVFIDHIDFISTSKTDKHDQVRIMLKNITQELKTLAIEQEIIIFLMCHIKKVEGREVEMQDIAESSGIYQLADYVFIVTRLNENVEVGNEQVKVATNEGIVKLKKNRLTGKQVFMRFTMENNVIKPHFN